jgi:predicted histidine transporter YuiF (NhaC family)
MPVVRKTVAIHPIIDNYVRKTWSMLIENGYDATYSTALNFMLLGAISEAMKEGGWSKETRNIVWSFMEDEKTINELNLEDHLASIADKLSVPKNVIVEIREKIKAKEKNIKLQLQKEEGKDKK